jgi:GNAT superfamily N-acetyltransferase
MKGVLRNGAAVASVQTMSQTWRTAGRVLAAPVSRRLTSPLHRWVSNHRGQPPAALAVRESVRVAPPVTGIRRRRPRDLGACARLLRVVFSEGQYPVYWPDAPRAWLDDEDVLDAWVAERQGEILGHVSICRVGTDPVTALRWREVTGRQPSELAGVSRLFVRPRVQRRGIGSALLDVAVAEIRARGLVPVLEVVTSSTDAISLFEDSGWRTVALYPWGRAADRLKIYYYRLHEGHSG